MRPELEDILDNKQELAYPAIKWLLDPDNRGEGRTTVMAIAYLEIGFENRMEWIKVRDHHPQEIADTGLLENIKMLADKCFDNNSRKGQLIEFKRDSFRVLNSRKQVTVRGLKQFWEN